MMKLKPTQPVIDLKEPIKSTDFVSLESIKNDRKTIGLKSVDDSQKMPRADQQGTLQKVMAEAAKQDSQLTPGDWQWLREAHKQAVYLDELKRRAQRDLGLEQIRLSDEAHARVLAEDRMNKRLAANLAAAKELYRVRNEQIIRAELEWREWIDKIDRKTIQNKRELLELFMSILGYKLGYIRQAWNQKHLTEIKKSLTKIALDRQAESQRLHLQNLSNLDKLKQESIRQKNNLELELVNNSRVEKLINFKQWQEITQAKHGQDIMILVMRSMGFKPGFLPLPSKQIELDEKIEKITRMQVEIEQNRKSELKELRTKLAELQSTALSVENKQKLLKKANHSDSEIESQKKDADKDSLAEYNKDRTRSFLAAMGYKLDFIPLPWKRVEIETKKKSLETILDSATDARDKREADSLANDSVHKTSADKIAPKPREDKSDPETPTLDPQSKEYLSSQQALQEPIKQPLQHPPQKPKLFKPAFPSIAPNAVDLKEQNDSLDRLALDKKRDQLENIEAVNLKMSQLQAASQLLQSSLLTSELNKTATEKNALAIDVRQKIKAAK